MLENGKIYSVKKKVNKMSSFLGDVPRWFLDWGDASPVPPLSEPMDTTVFSEKGKGKGIQQKKNMKKHTKFKV